jgi:ABC-type transport system involved in multi-copper enzyme maturation permease subunit
MNLPLAIATVWRLIVDTFRQSLASGIFWLIGAASLLIMVMCLSVHIDAPNTLPTRPGERIEALPPTDPEAQDPQKAAGVDIIRGELSFGFGLFRDKVAYEKDTQVRFLLAVLITVFVDTIGVLLALIWTAGFIPAFLEPSNASVLLAKPIPRWSLLAGKFLGVLAFMSLHAIIFIVGTWMALGIKTGVWPPEYLLGIPLLVLHFAVFFSFSTLLAVCFRSTVVCVFGTILIWLICWGMNWGRDMLIHVENGSPAPPGYMTVADKAKSKQPKDQSKDQSKEQPKDQAAAPAPAETTPATPKRTPFSATSRTITEIGYWVLPKPADMGLILYDAMGAGRFVEKPWEFQTVQRLGYFSPELSIATSILCMLVVLGLACYQFATMDY